MRPDRGLLCNPSALLMSITTSGYRKNMRPDRFQTLITKHLALVDGITKAQTFADAGHDRSQYGFVLHHHTGTASWWQIVATSRTGDDYSQPEAPAATGERPVQIPVPNLTGSPVATSDVEAAIAATLLAADEDGETARVSLYSLRETPGAISHGMSVDFHDGSKIFVYGLGSAPSGNGLRGNLFQIAQAV